MGGVAVALSLAISWASSKAGRWGNAGGRGVCECLSLGHERGDQEKNVIHNLVSSPA